MSAHFWWTLRRLWHRPHAHRMIAYERFHLVPDEHGEWYPLSFIVRHRLWQHDLRLVPSRIWRRLMIVWSYGPLACNGDDGGWRTRFCDWLEQRARAIEDKEEPHEQ